MNLVWEGCVFRSALHIAWCCQHFPSRVEHLDSELRSAADSFCATVTGTTAWNQWFAAVAFESAEWQKLLANFHSQYPDFSEQIALRCGPIQQMWEAQGPGLMFQLRELTSLEQLPEITRLYLVLPVLGGSGMAYQAEPPAMHLEAVLANEDPRLPETLRLAWLYAQVAWNAQVIPAGAQDPDSLAQLRTSLIPPVLAAAEELGLTECSPELTRAALQRWMPLEHDVLRSKKTNYPEELFNRWAREGWKPD